MTKRHIHHILTLTALIFVLNFSNSPVVAMELVLDKEDVAHKQNDQEIELKSKKIAPYEDISAHLNSSKIVEVDQLDTKTAVIIEYMQVINALLKYKKALGWENPGFTYFIHEEQDRVFNFLDKHRVLWDKYEDHKFNRTDLFLDLEIPIINRKTITTLLEDKEKKNIFQERLKQLEKNKKNVKKLVKKMILDLNDQYIDYKMEYSKFILENKESYANLSKEYSDYHRDYSRLLKEAKDQDYIFEKYFPDFNENYIIHYTNDYNEFGSKYPKLKPHGLKYYYQFLKLKSTQQKYEQVRHAVEIYNEMFPGLDNNPFEEVNTGCFSWYSCFGCYCCG